VYRYGDGTPFPLEENFIETITNAVEACTNAFMPLTQLDHRREQARAARSEADRELNKLAELEQTLTNALAPYAAADKKGAHVQTVASKALQTAKTALQQARAQVESRVQALEAQAAADTAADAVLHALRTFFDHHQLPNAKWIMSWDVRGNEPSANAVATAGRLQASFTLQVDHFRTPIRVDQLADAVVVHMMKKGLLGKAKPAPVDLGKYVMVAFERTRDENVMTLKEKPDRASMGLRFLIHEGGASWQSLSASGDAETDWNPLDVEDIDGVRRLGNAAYAALKDLMPRRTLVDLALGTQTLNSLPEPRVVPMEVLSQLTPFARTIRERSRVHGELVLKKDIGGGRREELYVPRIQLARHFTKLPPEYQQPFQDMGVSGEDTQPAIQLPEHIRPPHRGPQTSPGAPGASSGPQHDRLDTKTVKVEK
jgi:hypothetical protein